jgi:tripartite-type tricarboxylate transporter receptor subunit TctC
VAAAAIALPIMTGVAGAQSYPSRPITIVVPFAAGGPTDSIGRLLAEQFRASLGQTVIVENATGAGGTIGAARAARAASDGYTISLGQNGSHVVTGATYTNLPYDLLNDFEPLSLISIAPFVIVGKKTLPADDLKGLVAWLRANPGKATLGNAGQGSISHVCGLLFQDATGTRIAAVPYRGTAPAMQDLVAGQIDLMISDPVTSMPQVRGGNIKIYAVTAAKRPFSAPDTPTVTRPECPGSTPRCGTGSGCPRARRSRSSPSSMPRSWPPWRSRRCGPGWPSSGRRSIRATSRRRRRSAPCSGPRSRDGGRSSRPAASRWSDARHRACDRVIAPSRGAVVPA